VATTKSIKFAAPYTSSTFNAEEALTVGQNGVLTGCSVSTSAGVVSIQPGSFIQNGLIVSVDIPLTVTLPVTLVAPYSVVVTTSSSVENTGEVITPTFAQRPEDISTNSVVVADWDGLEWIARPKLQITELIKASQNGSVKAGEVGVTSGFGVALSAGNVVVSSGSLIDQQGALFTKTLSTSFVEGVADVDGLLRVDEVAYRRPDDDSNRPGSLQYIVGPTYNAGSTVQSFHKTQLISDTNINTVGKILNDPATNSTYFLYIANGSLKLVSSPDDMSTTTAVGTLETGVTGFDAILDPSGDISIVYGTGTNVIYQKFNTSAVSQGSITVATGASTLSNPKLVSLPSGATFFIHVVYEKTVSGSVHELFYARVSSTVTLDTSPLLLVDLSALVENPSLAKDDTDSLLLLGYENATTGHTYLREYDGSTSTAISTPVQIGLTLQLDDDTLVVNGPTVTTGTATQVKVRRAANKETYAFWLQDKGSSNYGVAYYNRKNISTFGHKAIIEDLVAAGENIAAYNVDLDGLSNAHFTLGKGTSTYKASLALESGSLIGTTTAIDANLATGAAIKFNAKGSLVHLWSYTSGGNHVIFFVKTSAGVFTNLRSFTPIHTDVALAHYRTDATLAVAGQIIDEHPTIRRLYEFLNCLGATGTVSWGVAGANKLAFTSAITLNFFNRVGTYSITAIPGGTTISANQVAYVQIPDADTDTTLTLQFASFGTGILDRDNRNVFPLFWNVGGTLYTRFAPFSLQSGEIIVLGDQMSSEMLTWLGASNSVPTTHAYSSTSFIGNSDSHETAIGELDARATTQKLIVNENEGIRFIDGGTFAFNSGTGVFSWSADIHISVPGVADAVNKIAAGNATLADGDVAYVTIFRSGSTPHTLSVTVAANSSVTLTDDLIIFARRSGSNLYYGTGAGTPIVTSNAYPTSFVASESDLSSAITTASGSGGGVICLTSSFSITSGHTVPTGTLLLGRKGDTVITVGSGGSLTFADEADMRDIYLSTALASGTLVNLSGNRCTFTGCKITVPSTSTTICIDVTASTNLISRCQFAGTLAPSTGVGIQYTSGSDNVNQNCVFLT
jgi:hypothetical protein